MFGARRGVSSATASEPYDGTLAREEKLLRVAMHLGLQQIRELQR